MPKTKAATIASMVTDYLDSRGETELLPEIIKSLTAAARKIGLVDSAVVTTPVKLSAAELSTINSYVKANYGSNFQLVEKIDPSLIAGFTIRIGDEVVDASLSRKLEIIRKELV